jgi:hypothetical protein
MSTFEQQDRIQEFRQDYYNDMSWRYMFALLNNQVLDGGWADSTDNVRDDFFCWIANRESAESITAWTSLFDGDKNKACELYAEARASDESKKLDDDEIEHLCEIREKEAA